MSANVLDQFSLPLEWPQAVDAIWDLDKAGSVAPEVWTSILNWLRTTEFDDRSYLAGEAAGVLIRDRAPRDVRERIALLAESADGWLQHCCIVALERDGRPELRKLLERAAESPHEVVRRSSAALLASRASEARA